VKTEDKEDLAYLEELIAANPKYTAQHTPPGGFDYSHMWSAVERGRVYVKIDDDIVCALVYYLGALLTAVSCTLKIRPFEVLLSGKSSIQNLLLCLRTSSFNLLSLGFITIWVRSTHTSQNSITRISTLPQRRGGNRNYPTGTAQKIGT